MTLARNKRKVRKVHTANNIYFFTYERFDPNVYTFTRDYTVVIPVMVLGITLSDHDDMLKGYDDATHEHLDDAGRTFQQVKTVWLPDVRTRPRNVFVTEGETTLTVFGESILT